MSPRRKQQRRALHVRLLDLHRVLGLVSAALITVLAISGTWSLIEHELTRIQLGGDDVAPADPETNKARAGGGPPTDAASHAEATEKLPLATPMAPLDAIRPMLAAHARAGDSFTFEWPVGRKRGFAERSGDAAQTLAFAPSSGRLLYSVKEAAAHDVTALHHNLLIPGEAGHVLTGLAGLYAALLVVSGVWLHLRSKRTILGERTRRSSPRVLSMHWHRTLGYLLSPILLVVIVTGATLGLAVVTLRLGGIVAYEGDLAAAIAEFRGQPADEALPPPTEAQRDAAFQRLADEIGAQRIAYLAIRDYDTSGETMRAMGYTDTVVPMHHIVTVQTADARLLENRNPLQSAGRSFIGVQSGVHFGLVGGVLGKLVYLFVGWALCWIGATGMVLATHTRRRARPRVVRCHELLLVPTTIGLPILVAIYLGLDGAPNAAWWFWGGLAFFALGSALPGRPLLRYARLLAIGGALLSAGGTLYALAVAPAPRVDRWVVTAQLAFQTLHFGLVARVAPLLLAESAVARHPDVADDAGDDEVSGVATDSREGVTA